MNPTVSRLTATLSLLALVAGSLALLACGPTPTGPTPYAPFSQEDLRAGTGDTAANGNSLRVHYTLWLYDPAAPAGKGLLMESSLAGEPFTFTLGMGQTISGWDQGVVGMQEGGLRRLVIPPSMGYRQERNGTIPPNSTLVFEIELIEVVPAAS
jgi:FKBP-type peptidyl-prolyl cis-trans isomerase FkpA